MPASVNSEIVKDSSVQEKMKTYVMENNHPISNFRKMAENSGTRT